jgi:hypothetical protein
MLYMCDLTCLDSHVKLHCCAFLGKMMASDDLLVVAVVILVWMMMRVKLFI